MEIEEIKEIDMKHVSVAAAGLIQRIESILPTITNDRVRQLVAVKLSTAISEGGNEAMLRQILVLAVAAVESSDLIEHKMDMDDLKYNIVTGEILSEIDCIPTLDKIIEFKKQVLKSLSSKKSNLKPPSSAI